MLAKEICPTLLLDLKPVQTRQVQLLFALAGTLIKPSRPYWVACEPQPLTHVAGMQAHWLM